MSRLFSIISLCVRFSINDFNNEKKIVKLNFVPHRMQTLLSLSSYSPPCVHLCVCVSFRPFYFYFMFVSCHVARLFTKLWPDLTIQTIVQTQHSNMETLSSSICVHLSSNANCVCVWLDGWLVGVISLSIVSLNELNYPMREYEWTVSSVLCGILSHSRYD